VPALQGPPATEIPIPPGEADVDLEMVDWPSAGNEAEPQQPATPPFAPDATSAQPAAVGDGVPGPTEAPMQSDGAVQSVRPPADEPPAPDESFAPDEPPMDESQPLVPGGPVDEASSTRPAPPPDLPQPHAHRPLSPPPLPPLPRPPAALGVHPSGSPRHRRSRSPLARLLAVLALAAVIVALILLFRSLHHSSRPTATVSAPRVVKVLVAEGKTRAQIAEVATGDGLSGSYKSASVASPLLNPVQYGAPHATPNLEGFLFPATYDMIPGEPAKRLVEEQLEAFRENFGASEIARAKKLHVTPYQLLTVASMVEREAQVPGDRAKIAAVIYNRLHDGMPLGIDATIYYAVELEKGISTYTHELTEAQLHISSPYNTRIHTGLPPTPISNPGLASIQAAAHPAHVGYLYYVAAADGCGEQVFSDTEAEFEANAAAYQAAEQKNGGHPPTCKRK
jgi:cell division protein YceG involved in septum cleavage